jgi:hypothetical protein
LQNNESGYGGIRDHLVDGPATGSSPLVHHPQTDGWRARGLDRVALQITTSPGQSDDPFIFCIATELRFEVVDSNVGNTGAVEI